MVFSSRSVGHRFALGRLGGKAPPDWWGLFCFFWSGVWAVIVTLTGQGSKAYAALLSGIRLKMIHQTSQGRFPLAPFLHLPTIFGILYCKALLMPMSGKRMLKLYMEAGWLPLRQNGSHVIVGKGTERETIPMHTELKRGLEAKLLKRLKARQMT